MRRRCWGAVRGGGGGLRRMDGEEETSIATSASFEARAAGRLGVRFLLDIATIGGLEGRMLDALLIAGVIEANINPLGHDPELQAAYARLDTPPPDELRRPVSVNALAASLRLPFETVRRHVKRLVAEGLCMMTPQGLYISTFVVDSPQFAATVKARYARVFEFYKDLLAVNAIEPLPYTPLPADHPDAPVRAVARILSDWFFRTIDAFRLETPDPLTGLVLLEILWSGSEHLSAAEVEEVLRAGRTASGARRPVRVAHVARRLGVPYETTRRHVSWLLEHGICERIGSGVVTSEGFLQRPALHARARDNHANIRRMFRQLAALGAERGIAERTTAGGL